MSDLLRYLKIVAVLAVGGCAQVPTYPGAGPGAGPEVVATLEVDGPNAFRNGAPAANGDRVANGDMISTGLGTSVRVVLRDGGYVQLDQNTDPVFQLFVEAGCMLVKVLHGQTFVDAKRVCISDPNIQVALNSRVNLRVDGPRSTLTVLAGSVTMSRPTPQTFEAFHQYTVVRGAPGRTVRLSPAEAEAAAAWTRQYFVQRSTGWCCTDGRLVFSTPDRCRKSGGSFFTDESAARQACRSLRQPTGWCCANGRLMPATTEQCRQIHGAFDMDEVAARRLCEPPSRPSGWCCAGGEVSQTTVEGCRSRGGTFYTDESTARKACPPTKSPSRVIPPEVLHVPLQGWCCIGESVSAMDSNRCANSNGRFFADEPSARRACVIR